MDIDRVRYFHVFSETGSLVKACEILHISQPALSKALKLLEFEVGQKLLESDGRGLRLTGAGNQFKAATAALLDQWLSLPEKLRAGANDSPTRIGSFEVFTTYFLSQLVKHIELETLELHEYGPGKLEQAIIDNKIDIGITYVPIPRDGIDFTEIVKIKMGVFGVKKFKSYDFVDLPFVTPLISSEGTPSKVIGLDGWPDHKFKRTIKYKVALMESALQLCRMGNAVAYLPEFVVNLHNENQVLEKRLVEFPNQVILKDRYQSVYLVQKKNADETVLYRQIAKSLRALKV